MGELIMLRNYESFSRVTTPGGRRVTIRDLRAQPLWRRTKSGAFRFDSWTEAKGFEAMIYVLDQICDETNSGFIVFDARNNENVLRRDARPRADLFFKLSLHERLNGVPERDMVLRIYRRGDVLRCEAKSRGVEVERRACRVLDIEIDGPHHRLRKQAAKDGFFDNWIHGIPAYRVHRISAHDLDLFAAGAMSRALHEAMNQALFTDIKEPGREVLVGWHEDGWRFELPDGSIL